MIYLHMIFVTCLLVEILIYFKIAEKFGIIDIPNLRSSHTDATIRGGGIIFLLAVLQYPVFFSSQYQLFTLSMLLICSISFVDDLVTLNSRIRLTIQIISAIILISSLDIKLAWYGYVLLCLAIISVINAYNFMDGINGLTAVYSLITVTTLQVINRETNFIESNFVNVVLGSIVVFAIFNFRLKAKCFAGDVGSVGMAFIVVFMIGLLIAKTHNFSYILLLLVYGLDTSTTMLFRFLRNENLFAAHRKHFYQFLANEMQFKHLNVALLYGSAQLMINIVLLMFRISNPIEIMVMGAVITVLFLALRFRIEGFETILKSNVNRNSKK